MSRAPHFSLLRRRDRGGLLLLLTGLLLIGLAACANDPQVHRDSGATVALLNRSAYVWTIEAVALDAAGGSQTWQIVPHGTLTLHLAAGNYAFVQTAHVAGAPLQRRVDVTLDPGGQYEWPLATLLSGAES